MFQYKIAKQSCHIYEKYQRTNRDNHDNNNNENTNESIYTLKSYNSKLKDQRPNRIDLLKTCQYSLSIP
jgi:hypothetical protein